MKHEQLIVNGVTYMVPQSWDGLTTRQHARVLRCLSAPLSLYAKKIALLAIIAGIPRKVFNTISNVQLCQLIHLANFLDHLPDLKAGKTTLSGPAHHFRNLTFEEFTFAETAFRAFINSETETTLNILVATMYRPINPQVDPSAPDYPGDTREAFNKHHIDARIKLVEKVSHGIRLHIASWYGECRKEIQDRFKYFFSQPSGKSSKRNLGDLIVSVAGPKFGTVEQTKKALLLDVLTELDQAAEQAENLNRKKK